MKKNVIRLKKDSSSNPRLALLISQMKEIRVSLMKRIENLEIGILDFSPDEKEIETIGTLLVHIAGVEWAWIFADIEKQEMDIKKWKYGFPMRNDINIPQIKGKRISYYIGLLNEVREEVFIYLSKLTDQDLDRIIEVEGSKFTVEWILYHLIEHEIIHYGQISILKRLYKKKID